MSVDSPLDSLPIIGILGGMGPAAGIDLCTKIVEQHHVLRDQDHIPFILHSVPQIPGRTEAILHDGESPVPAMLDGIRALSRSGATLAAVACITAHAWLAELRRKSPVPIVDVVDAVAAKLQDSTAVTIGLLATEATHRADVFGTRLETLGYKFVKPQDSVAHQRTVSEGIRLAKAGDLLGGGMLLSGALEELLVAGAHTVILGCTEIPVALRACEKANMGVVLDATAALADLCITRALSWSADFA